MNKQWIIKESPDDAQINELAKSLNISKSIAAILYRRKITDFQKAKAFFRPTMDDLHDPFLMKDLDIAVNRLGEAVFAGEKIMIYGDYDVDGTTSVALMYRFLVQFTDQLICYVPDRYTEGYGISMQGVRKAGEEGCSLIIALDCGITAIGQADLAKSLGLDLIICDHHLPTETLPDAFAVLDPKRNDCAYPFKELSGCGVGFKMLQGFCMQNSIPLIRLYQLLDLLAISIAADIVPMVGENRILAYFGLRKLNDSPSKGVKALIDISGFKTPMTITNVVFGIAPRINAAGRIGHALNAVKLLITEDEEVAANIAGDINMQNIERKDLDKSITEEAIEQIGLDNRETELAATVLYNENWHKGVIGIVASRCIEKYYKPTIILTASEDMITGSARSVHGFDIHRAISECSDVIEQFGGHKYAAGLTMKREQLPLFKEKFEEVVRALITDDQKVSRLEIEAEISLSEITFNFLNIINQMSPFGPANMRPVFVTRKLAISGMPRLLKEEHVKLTLKEPETNKIIEAIAFGFGEIYEQLLACGTIDIAYYPDINEYRGNKTLQLMIKDIKIN